MSSSPRSDWGAVVTRRAVKKPPAEGGWNIFITWRLRRGIRQPDRLRRPRRQRRQGLVRLAEERPAREAARRVGAGRHARRSARRRPQAAGECLGLRADLCSASGPAGRRRANCHGFMPCRRSCLLERGEGCDSARRGPATSGSVCRASALVPASAPLEGGGSTLHARLHRPPACSRPSSVMAIVAVFMFMLLHLSPGDPAAIIAGDNATPEQIAGIRKQPRPRRSAAGAVPALVRRRAAGRPRHLDLLARAGDEARSASASSRRCRSR